MASNMFISATQAQAQAQAMNVYNTGFGSGTINIYSNGTTQPANANTALGSGAVKLAQFTLPATANNSITSGVITFGSIANTSGIATGTASYFRILGSNGSTVVMDGNVGLSASTPDMVLDNTTITSGAVVSISSFTYTVTQ